VLVMVALVKENRLKQVVDEEDEEEKTDDTKLSQGEKRSLILILVSVFFWFTAYNAVTTMLSRYSQEVWGEGLGASAGYTTVATVAAIISFVPLGILSNKAGRKATVIIGIIIMIASFGAAFFISKNTPATVMNVIFAVVGIGWATINVHSFPMVVELCKGKNLGKYTGYYYTFSMAAQIVTPFLSGFLIDYTQWKERVLFPYAVVFMLLALVTMSLVKHGNAKPLAKDVILDALSGD
ncbi:MAG: MFS transporter, partial [Clostridia bacterium]|nr:MFS transporter [Clostridia bacterium]